MKKIIVLLLTLSLTATAISCKKVGDKISNAVLNVGGETDANAIIDFNNNFVDSYKNTTKSLERILKYTDEAVIKSKGGKVMIMPLITNSMDYTLSRIKEVPSGFGKDKAAIESDFNTYKAKKENIEKKLEELKSYMSSEDYKDDKGAKAEAIKKEIEASADDLYASGESVMAKIKSATDAAEEIILKDHPMKEYIISSKDVMNSLDSVIDLLGKQYEGKFNETEALKKYDEFAKLVEANSKMDFNVKDQQYSYKKSQFESFNKVASSFLDNYRKLISDSKEAGKIPHNNIQQIDSSYESVLSAYNTFVK
nr:DUF3829 domain-containing protein [uncultured Chryseobacterium sp.]